jgi:NitT/TauT family transport system ATP-binding protein|tara:strand:+ start:1232 stop:2014 length:783 start_codon:yes stop_codon:yes gene_type:complete
MIKVENLSLEYDKGNPILENVSFTVQAGQFVSLIGQSGSGKTSILRAIAGLQQPSQGKVTVEDLSSRVGFLFQDDALLPWRTVRQNVSLGLRIQGEKLDSANKKADDWLEKLSLFELGDRYPSQLSGGQRKRVAIAQVLALHPKVILMDEPFASLDAIVRTRITQELIEWVEQEQITVLLITHDLEEAISLSDAVHVLSPGPKAYIKASHQVNIPRPRDILDTRNSSNFAPLLKTLWNELVGERKKENIIKFGNEKKIKA